MKLRRKSKKMKFSVYAQDLVKVCDFVIDDEDNTPDAVFTFSWNQERNPEIKVHRADVDGGDFLPYKIKAGAFFESLKDMQEANICFDEEVN